MKELGGLRHAKKDSVNLGWRNASFRGYADYMSTPEFEEALASLMEIASERVTAIMCAEVARPVESMLDAGPHETQFDGSAFASGIYFARLWLDGQPVAVQKMTLIR